MKHICGLALVAILLASPAMAQTDNPLGASGKMMYDQVKGFISKAAEQMPESNYAFKPTPEVRSFGQLIGHIADSNFQICAATAANKPPMSDVEKTKTSKADLAQALKSSFDYCDAAFAGLTTDAKAAEAVDFFGRKVPRLSVLWFNTSHDYEHYGNIVTYMRLKGMVPPSSQRGGM